MLRKLKLRWFRRNLRSSKESVRRSAVESAARLFPAEAVALLRDALLDQSVPVRLAAVKSLASMKHARAVAPLIRALSDTSGAVSTAARAAIDQMDDAIVLEPLVLACTSGVSSTYLLQRVVDRAAP